MTNFNLYQYQNSNIIFDDKEKIEKFRRNIEKFKKISTIEEAKTLSKELFSSLQERVNKIYVGDIECTIRIESDMYRISIDSPTEFISYNFEYEEINNK